MKPKDKVEEPVRGRSGRRSTADRSEAVRAVEAHVHDLRRDKVHPVSLLDEAARRKRKLVDREVVTPVAAAIEAQRSHRSDAHRRAAGS